MNPNAFLILEDGSVWPGRSFGAAAPDVENLGQTKKFGSFDGEVIFNTGMTGYHEILTDPSYTGQIVMMTYPHIGNYGDDDEWSEIGPETTEKSGIKARGLVVRSIHDGPVPEGRMDIGDFLKVHGVSGISEVDTRALTLKFRREGSQNGVIVAGKVGQKDLPDSNFIEKALAYIKTLPKMNGLDLTGDVGVGKAEIHNENGSPHIALLDCGVKMNILRELTRRNCKVTILPSNSKSDDVLESAADALLLSNGPGDPEPLDTAADMARDLLGKIPLWGICLGHQVLARASGGKTYKMKFGHHGVNHPVRDEKSGRVFVTSQNHGFAVEESSLPEGFRVRFRNANDGSVEGIENEELGLLCVQHHPEAAPGPVDSEWIFDAFLKTLEK